MPIDPLPSAPLPTDNQATFNTKAFNLVAALGTFVTQTNAVETAVDADAATASAAATTASNAAATALAAGTSITGTSTSTLTIGTGSKSLTIETGRAFVAGMPVRVGESGVNANVNYMDGSVTSYDAGTGSLVVNITAVGGTGTISAWAVRATGLDLTKQANTFTVAQTFRAANAIRSEAASTQDAVVIAGRAGGTSSHAVTLTPTTLSANRTVTIPNETFTVGFRNLPAVGTQTGSYTLAVNDVGKYVQLGAGGSITIPTSTFAEGDAITIYNNTTGNITITCSAPTAYIAGTNTVKTSMTLATRGVATVLFYSATACVVTGNVS
jgi:hypothetical protein